MMEEKALLRKMLAEDKISEHDYKILSAVMDKKPSSKETISSFIINPFQRIAGFQALAFGILIIIAMSYIGVYAGVFFEGVTGSTIASSFKNAKVQPNLLFLLYENAVTFFSLTFCFVVAAKILGQKRIRLIDFFGTVAFSRLPYLLLVSYIVLERWLRPSLYNFDPAKDYEFHFSIAAMLSNSLWSFFYVWQIVLYYHALKVSSGLTGKKLWISFLISIVSCEMVGLYLNRVFL